MLTLLYGGAGAGKTTRLFERIEADLAAGQRAFLLVPEQYTVAVEKAAARRLPPSAPLLFEVSNFTRLADTVFRMRGGVACRYADGGTQNLLMWQVLYRLLPLLQKVKRVDAGQVATALRAVKELQGAMASPMQLNLAAEAMEEGSPLGVKLSDLSLILLEYEQILKERGNSVPGQDMQKLLALLREGNPLSGCRFYCDGFTSFTAAQIEVLTLLMKSGELTVALPMPAPAEAEGNLCYAEIRKTARELREAAARSGVTQREESLPGNRRARSRFLAALGEELWRTPPRPIPTPRETERGAVRVLECRTPFTEAELVASDIQRRIRAGAHYRDFAVVARDAAAYRGVLDAVFERYGIPCFFSLPSDLSAFEAVKLIRSAYAVCTGGWRREDVITYMKCGLSGIADDAADRFELYCEVWNLSGRRLGESAPLRLPPGGYERPRGERERAAAEALLCELNETREQMAEPLRRLQEICNGKFTIKEHAKALYAFLTALSVEKKLRERAEAARGRQAPEEAEVYARLFAKIVDVLDRVVLTVGDTEVYGRDFAELLELQFASASLSVIPPRADAVTVGSADMLRTEGITQVYLIGANRDVFPRPVEDNGLFSAEEALRLEPFGIRLDHDITVKAAREWHSFSRAFLSASEGVCVSYPLLDFSFAPTARSSAVDKLLALGGEGVLFEREEEIPPTERIFCPEAAIDRLGDRLPPTVAAGVREVLGEQEGFAMRLRAAQTPPIDLQATVSEAAMAALYPGDMALTQGRVDRYAACPFSYFCRYALKLGRSRRAQIAGAEVGTFVHAVLEGVFAGLGEGETLAALSDDALSRRIEALCLAYQRELLPEGEPVPPRLSHLFSRLRRSCLRLLREIREEMAQSDFSPLFFEYGLSNTPEGAAPLRFSLQDGTKVSLYGTIDRVDVYRRDGNAYLRVIDYKTGDNVFRLNEIREGANLQILIYLFSLWKSDRAAFLRQVGCEEGGEILPAGALYLCANTAEPTVATPDEAPDAKSSCSRSGILLHDAAVLSAMDHTGSGRFIPVRMTKDGIHKSDLQNLASLEKMGELLGEVEQVICGLAAQLKGGLAEARPGNRGGVGCESCEFRPLCRHTGRSAGEE